MTQTTFSDNVVIQGSQDISQLAVKGNTTQTQPLQNWQDNASNIKAQITGDGRFQIGNNLGVGSPADALIQANNDIVLPSSLPTSGWHTLGRITGNLTTAVAWVLHELQILGTGGVTGLQTAMRAKLTHNNSGNSTNAELRAADLQTINQTGTSGSAVGKATGLRATTSNAASAYLATAVGIETALTNDTSGNITQASAFSVVTPVNNGTIGTLYGLQIPDLIQATNNYAISTGRGLINLGDQVKIAGSADRQQLIVQANATQTNNLQEWRSSTGTVLASMSGAGILTSSGLSIFAPLNTTPLVMSAFSGNTSNVYGASFQGQFTPTGNISNLFQTVSVAGINGANSYNIGNAFAGYFRVDTETGWTGTVTNAFTVQIDNPTKVSGAHITNAWGLHINDITAGSTLNYAIQTGQGLVSHGDTVSVRHLAGNSSAPTVAAQAHFSSASLTRGTDLGGTVSVTAASSGMSGGPAVVITFATAYTSTPNVTIAPNDLNSLNLGLYISAVSTTSFTVNVNNFPTASENFNFSYHVDM